MITVKYPIALVTAFLWIGFVCAISFLEAWLKFRAPGITVPLGLGIGRLVFSALNKVEWVLATAMAISLVSGNDLFRWQNLLYLIPLIVLAVQTWWALPVLDARAEMYIQGQHVAPSNIHFWYVGLEFVKVCCLGIFGVLLFKA